VLIWPDNDDAGRKYAQEVAAILAALDCAVSILDPAALFALVKAQVNVTRDPAGYDAADALADWPDAAACARRPTASPSRSIRDRNICRSAAAR
jgi:hypothetical protein